MQRRNSDHGCVGVLLALSGTAWGQSFNGAITGVVKETTGGVVPDVALTLRNVATDQIVGTTVSGPEGECAFRNLAPARYEVVATKEGFQQVTHPDIDVTLSSTQRVEITLPVGTQEQRLESGRRLFSALHEGDAGAWHFARNPPATSSPDEQRTPCRRFLCHADARSEHGGNSNAFDARINGGMVSGDEATVDGVSMQQGFMSQGGMVSIFADFPMSPDMVSEVKVLTSNYAPDTGRQPAGRSWP